MFKRLWLFAALVTVNFTSVVSAQVELANLREDVRGLTQRVGELSLKVEELDRENRSLRGKAGSAEKNYATFSQLNEAVVELNRTIKSAVATSKTETLQHVGVQMEKLAKATNAAIESLARVQTARTAAAPTFSDDYPKQSVTYTVQKGDNIASIAKKTGAKQQDIINANKLSDPSVIMLGQTLVIPLSAPSAK